MATDIKYENIRLADEEARRPSSDHDDSSTEVDESLLGADEKHWRMEMLQSRRPSKRQTCWAKLSPFRWIFEFALLLAILGLMVRDQLRVPMPHPWDFGGDFTGLHPRSMSSRTLTRTTYLVVGMLEC